MRPTTGVGGRDDILVPVAIDVADCDINTAGKVCGVREEAANFGACRAVEQFYVWPAAWPGRSDNVGEAIAGYVAGRHPDTAPKRWVISIKLKSLLGSGRVECAYKWSSAGIRSDDVQIR